MECRNKNEKAIETSKGTSPLVGKEKGWWLLMDCPNCGIRLESEHERVYNGKYVEWKTTYFCPDCGYAHEEVDDNE